MKNQQKNSTKTPIFSSLEKQNITTIINNKNNNSKNNNNHNNNKNTSNSKKNSNTWITLVLPKTDANFNYVAVKEEKTPVPKKVLLSQNTNIEKHVQKDQIRLPKLKNGKSTREYIFQNVFTEFMFFIMFFGFLFRHFTVVDEPTLNFNFYKRYYH